jgi:PAS domain S-box-containing protein
MERKTAAQGYFFSGRLWNKEYLGDLEGLLGSSASIVVDLGLSGGHKRPEAPGALFIEIPLPGWDGKPIGHLNLLFKSSVLEQYETLSKKNIFILVIITALLFFVISFYLNLFLISPLAVFSKALKQEAPLYLEALKENKDEFGEISRLFINFLEQKKLLVQEVEARRFAESSFAKLNDAFLRLGLDFSANAAILTSICGEILGSSYAMYRNYSRGMWLTVAGWNVPKDFNFEDRTQERVCYDVVQAFGESGQVYRIRLQKDQAEPSADSGPLSAGIIGRLCVFFVGEPRFNEMQTRFMEICAKALAIEEERRRVNEMLRENQERWQFAIEGSEEGVWDWDIAANKILFSKRWKELLGYSVEEIKNDLDEWYARVHPEDIADLKESLDKHLKGDVPIFVSEYRMRCKDGSYRLFFDRGKVVKQSVDGRPLRLVGTHTDMTGQNKS